jgi:ferritin-like metal-binding protein YciE
MENKGLRELYIDELKDLYSAENQLVKALPKMAKAASSDELRSGFEEHLEQTKGSEAIGEYEDSVLDAALIGAAQRVEHYEMAAYGTVRAFAEELGETEQASLLSQTFEEEKQTDEKLSTLAKEINPEANQGEEEAKAPGSLQNKNKSKRVA